MSDLTIGSTNDAENGTELIAQSSTGIFAQGVGNHFILQVRPDDRFETSGITTVVDGVRAFGANAGNGVFGSSSSGDGVRGESGAEHKSGVVGINDHGGAGVFGRGRAAFPAPHLQGTGVLGNTETGTGVSGTADSSGTGVSGTSNGGVGVEGTALLGDNAGVLGDSTSGDGVKGTAHTSDKSGVFGFNPANVGVFGAGAAGVGGQASNEGKAGVFGTNDFPVLAGTGGAAFGTAGVQGSSSAGDGVIGIAHALGKSGVIGLNTNGTGVFGTSVEFFGVDGSSENNAGVRGFSKLNNGVLGTTPANGKAGIFGENLGKGSLKAGFQFVGVSGKADDADGFGLFGDSAQGTGVSASGGTYGGIFRGEKAPLRLTPASTSGAPSSGFHRRGEFFVDANGALFYCNQDGDPGNWVKLA